MIGCLRIFNRRFSILPPTVSQLQNVQGGNNEVSIDGWVSRAQKFGKMTFARLTDGSAPTTIQVVIPREVCKAVRVGAAVTVSGNWQKSGGDKQSMELLAKKLILRAMDSDPRYSDVPSDKLREKVYLRAKNEAFAALMRLRAKLSTCTHRFFESESFIYVDGPILTANDCEGAGEVFKVISDETADFFGPEHQMYLSVSGQFHLEALCNGIARVYSFNPFFRADEQPFSRTHLSEFRMLEAEIAFCDSLNKICDIVEAYIRRCAEEIQQHEKDLSLCHHFSSENSSSSALKMIERRQSFPRITYEEAKNILEEQQQPIIGSSLSRTNELFLVDHFSSPLFVTHFPASKKPFYMKRSENLELTESFDFLMPGVGEVAGGSIRENDIEILKQKLPSKDLEWYIEIRDRGKPISSGFGVGFDRLVQSLLGVSTIRDVMPFPRWHSKTSKSNAQC